MNSVKKREVQNTHIKDTQPGDKHSKHRKTGITEAEMPRSLQSTAGRRWVRAAGEVSERACWDTRA